MRNWLTKTRFRLIGLPLLLCILLSACGQSTSHDGESIDSIYASAGKSTEKSGVHVERVSDDVNQVSSSEEQGSAEQGSGSSQQAPSENIDQTQESQTDHRQAEAENREEAGVQEPSGSQQETDLPNPSDVAAAQAAAEEREKRDAASSTSESAEQREQKGEPTAAEAPQEELQEDHKKKWEGDNKLTFAELYESVGVRGIVLSEKVEGLTGETVEMNGYMAPPLTAGVRFFVLTKALMAVCPFCSTDADWPTDIVVVYLPDGEELRPTEHPVKVTGRLDTGSYTDEDTGFVSLVRIYADKVEVMR